MFGISSTFVTSLGHYKKKQNKNKNMLHLCEVFLRVFFIWLVNRNWKKSNIIFTIIWKFKIYIFMSSDHPANKRNKPNADSMTVHCLRRQSGTKSTLGRWVSLLCNSPHRHHNKTRYTSTQCRYNADPAPRTVGQHCSNTTRTLRACRYAHKPHTYKRYLHVGDKVRCFEPKLG